MAEKRAESSRWTRWLGGWPFPGGRWQAGPGSGAKGGREGH